MSIAPSPVFLEAGQGGDQQVPEDPEPSWWEQEAGDAAAARTMVPPGPDPEPAWDTDIGRSATSFLTSKSAKVDIPKSTRADIEGVLALAVMLPADLLVMMDPYCGQVFLDQAPKMVKAMVPLIAQSQTAVKWVTSATGLVLWGNLFMASKPVLTAVVAHHVTKRVATVRDEQGHKRVEKADLSAYTAA